MNPVQSDLEKLDLAEIIRVEQKSAAGSSFVEQALSGEAKTYLSNLKTTSLGEFQQLEPVDRKFVLAGVFCDGRKTRDFVERIQSEGKQLFSVIQVEEWKQLVNGLAPKRLAHILQFINDEDCRRLAKELGLTKVLCLEQKLIEHGESSDRHKKQDEKGVDTPLVDNIRTQLADLHSYVDGLNTKPLDAIRELLAEILVLENKRSDCFPSLVHRLDKSSLSALLPLVDDDKSWLLIEQADERCIYRLLKTVIGSDDEKVRRLLKAYSEKLRSLSGENVKMGDVTLEMYSSIEDQKERVCEILWWLLVQFAQERTGNSPSNKDWGPAADQLRKRWRKKTINDVLELLTHFCDGDQGFIRKALERADIDVQRSDKLRQGPVENHIDPHNAPHETLEAKEREEFLGDALSEEVLCEFAKSRKTPAHRFYWYCFLNHTTYEKDPPLTYEKMAEWFDLSLDAVKSGATRQKKEFEVWLKNEFPGLGPTEREE